MNDDRIGGRGLLNVRTNSELVERDRAAEREKTQAEDPIHIKKLAAHIRKAFEQAEHHKAQHITDRLLDCQRRRKGEYDPERLAEIDKQGGCKTFFNITDTKCGSAEAWIQDVIRPTSDEPWGLEATPIPDLPEEAKDRIINEVVQRFQRAQMAGDEVLASDVQEFALEMYAGVEQALSDEAQERADLMTDKIMDQHAEGGWQDALDDAIRYLCTYMVCVIHGPEIKQVKRLKWVDGKAEVVEEPVPTWRAVDPHDIFPAPNIRNVNEGYICERVRIPKAELAAMRGAEGYSTDDINAVLSKSARATLPAMAMGESERAALEGRDSMDNDGAPSSTVDAIVYWGSVQGCDISEWGMDVDDDNDFYPITAILIGDHVIKAIPNPDPLGRIPYFVTSYEKVSGDFWGKAIAEKMADCQDAVNACMRNALNNLGLASGPMMAVDVDAMDPAVDPTLIYPWKPWQYHGNKASGSGSPVTFFQPNANSDELLRVSEYFEEKADDRTLIPRYAHGNDDVGGAGKTASGLSMLMNAAAKGIKRVIYHIDQDIIRPAIEHLYRWNLTYLPDEEYAALKGDVRVIPRGVISALVKEEMLKRRTEWLGMTNNDTDMQIIGVKGRAAVLRSIAGSLDMPEDKIVPSEDDLEAMLRQEQEDMAEEEAIGTGIENAPNPQGADA